MSTKRKLGRGLGSLIPEAQVDNSNKGVTNVNINLIKPNKGQPRKFFDEDKLNELAASIENYGVIQPIILNKNEDNEGYTIIAGERRFRASRIANLKEIPAVIHNYSSEKVLEIALIENIQREDLNAIEEAMCYKKLKDDFFFNNADISKKVSKSSATIASTLSLLQLEDETKELVIQNKLKPSHAKALLNVNDKDAQILLANQVVENDLSLTDLNRLIEKANSKENETENKKDEKQVQKNVILTNLENDLQTLLGLKINIRDNNNKGKLEINYTNHDELEEIINVLKNNK